MMKNFWTYKVIKPTVSQDKIKRDKRIKLINNSIVKSMILFVPNIPNTKTFSLSHLYPQKLY